jgi:trk system potassium uptake protein TrkH
MHFRIVLHLVSFLLMMLAGCMAATAAVSWGMGDPRTAWLGMLESGGITLVAGALMWAFTRTRVELTRREGIGIVVFGWFAAVLFSALPFLLAGAMTNPADALFESCSGLTTTGASVMSDLEQHSRAILFWRAVLHLLGGMGILVLVVAIIPYLGVGGMQIYRAEVTGPSKDRLTPRIASTAKLLWGVYLLFVVVLISLLKLAGMDWFDAVCHSFATISTGGFSTRSASIAAFDSRTIETIITVFMLLSGINFALHFRALRGQPVIYFRDPECKLFLGVWFIAVILMTADIARSGVLPGSEAFRHAVFYSTSILTCTGFGTVDYDQWPVLSQMTLVILFIIGGCAGSTSGGIKQIRFMVLMKKSFRDARSFLKPQAIFPVKVGPQIISAEVVQQIAVFFFIYLMTVAAATLIMSPMVEDLATAFSSVIACAANVGPGFSTVGPVQNYAHLPDLAKLVLSGVMIMGRLEFFTVLVIVLPTFWRK